MVSVTARFNVAVTGTDLIKGMAKKVQNDTYAKMIIQYLSGGIHDLEELCTKINKIQSLTKLGRTGGRHMQEANDKGKEV